MRTAILFAALGMLISAHAGALEYPGAAPSTVTGSAGAKQCVLANDAIRCEWNLKGKRVAALSITNVQTGDTIAVSSGHMPRIELAEGKTVDLAKLKPEGPVAGTVLADGQQMSAVFHHKASGLRATWTVDLRDGSNYINQTLELSAERKTQIESVTFLDARIENAVQVGEVDGSVVTVDDVFLAVEHPLAKNEVGTGAQVSCSLHRGNTLQPDRPWRFSSVMGVVPPDQLRRGFLYYLERRRARAYEPFLHYNSWYHLNIERPDNHMTEAQCVETIEYIGRELVTDRGVDLDAFVWDDGWDDFNSLWGFHSDFPDGFKGLRALGQKYGAAQGVWMSPWGGYGEPRKERLAYGKSQGYELNRSGFSMAGRKYGTAFRDICFEMMDNHGVVFFKFDGMGAGNSTGASGRSADDIDAVLSLTETLREKNSDVFISATVGTWASPFWTCYADSIWRQGGDTGLHGPGNTRQQWITYRDMHCYQHVVKAGPLYPLNSLMLHGPCIGDRATPGKMTRDEKSVADEIWTFFGSGTNLQELYISPHLLTERMWDELASAATWSRTNSDVLIDSHWIGGDPGAEEVYGWSSWRPGKGIVVLRNPSESRQVFDLTLANALELTPGFPARYRLESPRTDQRIGALDASPTKAVAIELEPFEVLVLEAFPAAAESH
ncbi:MAG: enterotoxin [bacterium]|nr:enterotoxin [bacterium]